MKASVCEVTKEWAERRQPQRHLPFCSNHRDVAQAAEVAIEHRNETELSLVLSHCTGATDGAIADKIQRARAQAQKK